MGSASLLCAYNNVPFSDFLSEPYTRLRGQQIMGRRINQFNQHQLIPSYTTTTTNSKRICSPRQMAQAVATTAKALGVGVASLTAIGYIALWGGQRQVTLPPAYNWGIDIAKVGIPLELPTWFTDGCS
jgi:hypothetical protein